MCRPAAARAARMVSAVSCSLQPTSAIVQSRSAQDARWIASATISSSRRSVATVGPCCGVPGGIRGGRGRLVGAGAAVEEVGAAPAEGDFEVVAAVAAGGAGGAVLDLR